MFNNNIIIEKTVFIRSFKVVPNNSFDIFLGSGASISSGIPSGNELVWHFKKEILSAEGKINGNKINDLKIGSNRKLIQSYFNIEEEKKIKNLYSYYFEKCYPDAQIREDFLTTLIKNRKPTIGHICLSALINYSRLHNVWTTNFDDLVEKAVNSMGISCAVISAKDSKTVSGYREDIPKVVKLHGDFKYDALQNTDEELQDLESSLSEHFISSSQQKGLIVIGYSGSDESVIKALQKAVNADAPFPRGLIWCLRKDDYPSETLISIMNEANKKNKNSGFMYIDTFDYFLFELYHTMNVTIQQIDSLAKVHFEQKKPFLLNQRLNNAPLMFNAIKANSFPSSYFVAKTNIPDWKMLREHIKNTNIVAALSRGYTYLMGEEGAIRTTFGKLSSSSIEIQDIPEKFYYRKESFYLSLLYDLIEKSLVSQHDLSLYTKGRSIKRVYSNKHFLSDSELNTIKGRYPNFRIPTSIQIFEAFEYKVEFINKELFFIICPCVHIQNVDGTECKKEVVQYLSNVIYSNRYNAQYGNKLKFWFNYLRGKKNEISFTLGEAKIKLSAYYSTASIVHNNLHNFDIIGKIAEPFIYFHHQDQMKRSIHPIHGLKLMGTLENSYNKSSFGTMSRIKLGIISPASDFNKVKEHISKLQTTYKPKWEQDYLKEYPGFEAIYKKTLCIPDVNSDDVILISDKETLNINAFQFYEMLKKKIEKFIDRFSELDCVIIYIPNKWEKFRENKSLDIYFDLHDSLKIYCVKRNIKIQFIEDKSIEYGDIAKVLWWLSLGIYVKANGTPWKIRTDEEDTAFVGLGYALRQNAKDKVVLGSSQIFDNNGNGLKFLLQPIENPVYYKKNPFMSKDDAFKLVSNIRNIYNRIDPIKGLNKVVIHKTTPFTSEEIEGINSALAGIENIELVQIQQVCSWRALRLKTKENGMHDFDSFPVERGFIVQIDDYSFLLWTHGVVNSPEFSKTYYQNKRGIPAPLLITRFLGKDPIERLASDILKFTKMNWNGAELYKTLPVTIDFSRRLSIMGKQLEDLGVKPYDFRYFI